MKTFSKFMRAFTYARRAHGVYFAIIFNQLTNTVIYYRLMIEKAPELQAIFPRYYIFFTVFTLAYSVIAISVGWLDYRWGSIKTDHALNTLASPVQQDTLRASILAQQGLQYHCLGDDERANQCLLESVKLLERWTND